MKEQMRRRIRRTVVLDWAPSMQPLGLRKASWLWERELVSVELIRMSGVRQRMGVICCSAIPGCILIFQP